MQKRKEAVSTFVKDLLHFRHAVCVYIHIQKNIWNK